MTQSASDKHDLPPHLHRGRSKPITREFRLKCGVSSSDRQRKHVSVSLPQPPWVSKGEKDHR